MNEFTIIDENMPDVPPPIPGRVAEMRARVLRSDRESPARRRSPWAGVLVASAATAAVIVAVAVTLGSVGGPPTVAASPPPEESLDTVADRLAQRTEPERGLWRSETESIAIKPFDKHDLLMELRSKQVVWAGPQGPTLSEHSGARARPFSAADQERWEKAGSPDPCAAKGCDGVPPGRTEFRLEPADGYRLPGIDLSSQELRDLPQDPVRLGAELVSLWKNSKTKAGLNTQPPDDVVLWQTGAALIVDMPATPGTRAAALRMLAGLPDVEVVMDAEDADGRAGMAIVHKNRGGLDARLVIDRATGDPLALQYHLARPDASMTGLQVGDLIAARVMHRIGWVDDRPDVPAGCTDQAEEKCLR